MQFYYLLIILLLNGCASNKKQISTQTNMTAPDPAIQEISKPTPIELSYDNSLDIMLVESSFRSAYNCAEMSCLYNDAIYWNSNDNIYYAVTNTELFWNPIPVTNTNTNFIYSIDTNKQIEPVFYPDYQEIFTNTGAPILYIGDLSSPLERVYLDPTNQVYYIKQLESFDTSIYKTYDNNQVITQSTLPVYPAMFTNMYTNRSGEIEIIPYLNYTNDNKQLFIIIYSEDKPILYSSGRTTEDD